LGSDQIAKEETAMVGETKLNEFSSLCNDRLTSIRDVASNVSVAQSAVIAQESYFGAKSRPCKALNR
jgi:hypothetical protein